MALHLVTDTPTAMRAEIVGVALSYADRQARYVPLARDAAAAPHRVAAAGARAGSVGDPKRPPPRRRRRGGSTQARDLFSDTRTDARPRPCAARGRVREEARRARNRSCRRDVGGLDRTRALEILKPLFEDAEVAKTGHDLKNMAIVLARQGIKLRGLETDTILVSYVLDATRSDHRLEDLALEELTYRMTRRGRAARQGREGAAVRAACRSTRCCTYAGERADLTWQLGPRLSGDDDRRRTSIRSITSWNCRSCPC